MEYIRLIHPKHYDPRRNEFKSLAFKNSSNDCAASVLLCKCLDESQNGWCGHIRHYYTPLGITSEPALFLEVIVSKLPTEHRIEQDMSDGDECHYVIFNVSDGHYRKLLKSAKLADFMICRNGHFTPATDEDARRFAEASME
jgi:hypothetical protein